MSSAFSDMYRSFIHLELVDVDYLKDTLRYLTDPTCFDQPCVPPDVYQNVTSTKDFFDRLYPKYVNPAKTFVLEEIIRKFGSKTHRCKRLLRKYTKKYCKN